MARQTGGIFGGPSGSIGPTTWQPQRGRRTRATVSRERPIPYHPRTDPQTLQRDKMAIAVQTLSYLPGTLYKPDWSNAQPFRSAYQILLSYYLRALEHGAYGWRMRHTIAPVYLGPTHFPANFVLAQYGPSQVWMYWTTGVIGDHCSAADTLSLWVTPKYDPSEIEAPSDIIVRQDIVPRSAGSYILPVQRPNTQYTITAWFRCDAIPKRPYFSRAYTGWYEVPAAAGAPLLAHDLTPPVQQVPVSRAPAGEGP